MIKEREKRKQASGPIKTFPGGLEKWLIAENNKGNTKSTSGNIYFAKKGPEGHSF